MAGPEVDAGRHDQVLIYVDAKVYNALEAKCAPGQTVDDLVAKVLGDEALWRVPARVAPQPRAMYREPVYEVVPQVTVEAPTVLCKCCKGRCRCLFMWRGSPRCGCNADRLAYLNAGGKISE